jgi:Uri superfamily endonuclease
MIDLQDLPTLRGTYVLHLSVAPARSIGVGRLGQQHFPMGDYFYVGSARGAGGLRARVGRHRPASAAPHSHIDYLRACTEVRNVFYTVADTPLECAWHQALVQLSGAFIPVPHFGSGDCRSGCRAHLVAFHRRIHLVSIKKTLSAVGALPVVQCRCG